MPSITSERTGTGAATPIAVAALALSALGAAALAHGHTAGRFHRRVARLERELVTAPPAHHLRQDLPAAIEAFARRNAGLDDDWTTGGPVAWRMEQTGAMRMSGDGPWLPFAAEQTVALREPGFLWFATMRGPGPLDTEVLDAFVADRGTLEARVMGSVPVARVGGPEADVAEAMRYLAELPWAPLAILCNPFVHWRRLAEDLYDATLHTGSGPATVRFHLDKGDIVLAEADARMWTPGRYLPWRGAFAAYGRVSGVRVPLAAEVGWMEPDGWRPYWRGELLAGGYVH